jgi:ABC-type antimicrobial peptide transport system ATPase subunit
LAAFAACFAAGTSAPASNETIPSRTITTRSAYAATRASCVTMMTGEKVMDLLVGLAREQGTTVIIVTHDARVAAYADRVVMVRDGLVSFDAGAEVPAAKHAAKAGG